MSDVIFYCTKYTTKPQQDVYCSVALALASFRRRQEREKAIAELRPLSSDEISRKRVTGLMYTMTNSIEVAGPLAALYILRGSPSYPSHEFQSLPLYSIIKWITPEDVPSNENDSAAPVNLVKSFSFTNNKDKENNKEKIKKIAKAIAIAIVITVKAQMICFQTKPKHVMVFIVLFVQSMTIFIDLTSSMIYHYMNFIVKYIDKKEEMTKS